MININDKLRQSDRDGILAPIFFIIAVLSLITAILVDIWFILGVVGCGFFAVYMSFIWMLQVKKSMSEKYDV